MKKTILVLTLLVLTSPIVALEVKEANQLILEVKGVVCSFCAYGMSKNLSKLEFVNTDLFEKGVHTDIKKGHVTLAINPNERIDFREIKKRIKKGGYELKGIHLYLKGPISKANNMTTIENKPSGQVFELRDSDGNPWKENNLGKEVAIQGYISEAYLMEGDFDASPGVQVKSPKEISQEAPDIDDKNHRKHKH